MAEKTLVQLYANDDVAVEMARRKVMFHNDEHWDTINLWGLFKYTAIKKHLADGRLINNGNYKPENVVYWVTPSKDYWEDIIKPIVDRFTKDELNETFYY